MESIFASMDGVIIFLDDILIGGVDYKQNLIRVECVLSKLQEVGLKVSVCLDKCNFFQSEICYSGYIVNKKGLQASPDKVMGIKKPHHPVMFLS